MHRIALLLAGLDRAARGLAADAVPLDDEAAAVEVGQFCESDLIALLGKDLAALLDIRRPGTVGLKGENRRTAPCAAGQHHRCQRDSTEKHSTRSLLYFVSTPPWPTSSPSSRGIH